LAIQGEPFEGKELENFEQDLLKDEIIKLRKRDDQAKIAGIEDQIHRAEFYKGIILSHLEATQNP
jgi:2-amino-1-hydroxyethylphosphonate dioxygenase (glycine-forming)